MATKRDRSNEPSYADRVAEKLIQQLQEGTAPWQKPWKPGELRAPYNPTTDKPYRGFNAVWLMAQGQGDPRWMTYKQAAAAGCQVRKGEKGTYIQYAKMRGEEPITDESGKPVLDDQGKPKTQMVEYERPRIFGATVFNGSQIDGLPELTPQTTKSEWERHEQAEAIMQASGVPIRHQPGDRAYYQPGNDSITLPNREQFDTADGYYATALHELGHATGHPSRLNRDLSHPFGSEGYAKEELRAEIASLMLGERLELGHDPGQHAAYVGSWIKALKDDPREIMRAAADAEKIASFVQGWAQKQEQEQEQEPVKEQAAVNTGEQQQSQKEPEADKHYSDRTLQHLIENHGWDVAQERGGTVTSVKRQFEGVGPTGTVNTPNGERNLMAGYNADQERRRYIAVSLGDKQIADIDGRDNTPADVARLINIKAEQFADEKRAAQGLEPKYAVGSPTVDIANVSGKELEQTALQVERYDEQRDKQAGASQTLQAAPAKAEAAVPAAVRHQKPENPMTDRTYLAVPFREKDQAKEAGARWDKEQKSWYAPKGADMQALSKWMPENRNVVAPVKKDPTEEFAEVLRANGLVVGQPIMDGEWHRVPVQGHEGSGKKDGAYMARRDGHPNGFFKNHVQDGHEGKATKWVFSGTSEKLSTEDRQELAAAHAAKMAQREAEREAKFKAVGEELAKAIKNPELHRPASADHPYLVKKGLQGDSGNLLQDKRGNLVVPAQDQNGNITTLQWIGQGGAKGFVKDSKLEGSYHIANEKKDGPIFIGEGWATMETIRRATDATVVTAFNAGNLEKVAKTIREQNPDRPIVIAGDNDHQREAEGKTNVGKEAAERAAKAVGGYAAIPSFAPDSKGSDWNDMAKEKGTTELQKALNESMVLADRRRLADAQMLGNDGERVEEIVRQNQAKMENQKGANVADMKSAYADLRLKAGKEADRQDKSDEAPKQDQEQEQEQEQQKTQTRSRGTGRSRSR